MVVWEGMLEDAHGPVSLRVVVWGSGGELRVEELDNGAWIACADDALVIEALSRALVAHLAIVDRLIAASSKNT